MNRIKSIVYLNQRGYKHARRSQSLNVQRGNKVIPTKKERFEDTQEDDFKMNKFDDDLDNLEADFMQADKTYEEHRREVAYNKEILKMRIIASKYFKQNEPNFLTWSDKHQIKMLHDKDNEEWTPERLSTAFPALPATIQKILRSSYQPKTIDEVIRYDKDVIDNWNQFKVGKLALSPKLEAHLQKFRDRKIQVGNLKAIAEQFVKPKPIFPPPKCTMFSSIVKDCTESDNISNKKPLLQLTDGKTQKLSQGKDLVSRYERKNKIKSDNKYITSDVFLERQVNKIVDTPDLSVEDQFFIHEYKEKKNQETVINSEESIATKQSNKLESVEKIEITESSVINNKTLEPSTVEENTSSKPVMQVSLDKIETYKNSLDTGIIKWERKSVSSEEGNYPQYIKVPYQKAKKKVTFRVKDCYYDCDGEFLYRVPGLKSN